MTRSGDSLRVLTGVDGADYSSTTCRNHVDFAAISPRDWLSPRVSVLKWKLIASILRCIYGAVSWSISATGRQQHMKCNWGIIIRFRLPIAAAVFPLLIALAFPLQAREISMLTVEWAPHYGSNLPEKGLTTAIVKAAFKAVGHSSDVDFIPWARALKEVEEGKSDIIMGAYHNKEREEHYIFSDPIYFLELGLIARPGLGVSRYDSLRDLTPYRIGISRGFANSAEFDAANYLDKHAVTFPNLNIRKLFRGRIDMAVMNFDLFRHEARKEGFCISDVEFMDPPLETHGLYLMASRNISDGQQIIQDFNQGLDAIRKNGGFDRIVGRFRK